ncbi:MAG: hypothetical protein ACYCYO_23425 [Bacilli bacterium]
MKTAMRADHLKFLKERVLNIQDITRSKKLTQILDSYAERVSDEVFVIQNDRKKEARAVIADLEYFEELLMYREAVEQAIDDGMDEVARERKDTIADIPLGQVVAGLDLDVDRIVAMSEDFAKDED